MKVLLCHNHYLEPEGEDQVFDSEGWLLESHGHNVLRFTLLIERYKRVLSQVGKTTPEAVPIG